MVLFTEKGGFLLAAFTHAVSSGTATPLTRIDRSVFAEFAKRRALKARKYVRSGATGLENMENNLPAPE